MRGLTLYVRRHMYNIHKKIKNKYIYIKKKTKRNDMRGLTLYVRSRVVRNAILCHIIIHTMSHHHTYYVTSSYILYVRSRVVRNAKTKLETPDKAK